MDPPGFVRVDMEGSPYTQRTSDFVHELHRMPGNANSVGTVIQSYLKRSEGDVEKLLAEAHPHSACAKARTRNLRRSPSRSSPMSMPTMSS